MEKPHMVSQIFNSNACPLTLKCVNCQLIKQESILLEDKLKKIHFDCPIKSTIAY